jgi:addiction module HigA family antidote
MNDENNIDAADLTEYHPGIILKTEYLPEMGISKYRLAKMLLISEGHVGELLEGKRNVTANMALRLGRLFGQSPEIWMAMQSDYDLRYARLQYGAAIERIEAFAWPSG